SLPSRDHQPQDLRFQPPTGIGAATLRATRTWLWPAPALHRSIHVLEIDSHQLRNEPLVLPSDDRVADLGELRSGGVQGASAPFGLGEIEVFDLTFEPELEQWSGVFDRCHDLVDPTRLHDVGGIA